MSWNMSSCQNIKKMLKVYLNKKKINYVIRLSKEDSNNLQILKKCITTTFLLIFYKELWRWSYNHLFNKDKITKLRVILRHTVKSDGLRSI